MALSKRSKKRFLILGLVMLVIAGGIGTAYVLRERQLDQKSLAALDTGMSAYESSDYESALHNIGTYLQRHSDDAEADTYFAYAYSRLNVPVPNDRHISQGIAMMERVLEVDPNHEEAIGALLELRLRIGQTLEAIALADKVLARDPGNIQAHETRVWAYQISGNIDAAIEAARAQQKQHPDDLEAARRLIGLMLQVPAQRRALTGDGNSEGLLAQIRADHKQSPAHMLMIAQAYRALNDPVSAEECLQATLDLETPDTETATLIASEMMRSDAFGFEPALGYVESVIEAREDAGVLRVWLAQQRFFLGESESARQVATEVAPDFSGYASAQALLALLAGERGDLDAVRQHVDNLRGIGSDEADMWARVLEVTHLAESPKAADVRPVLLEGVQAFPENRYFRFALAVAYRDLGEPEMAVQQLGPVVQAEPAWWVAALELSGLFESTGNYRAALQVLEDAYRLHSGVDAVRTRRAILISRTLSPSDPIAARELLEEVNAYFDEVVANYPEAKQALLLVRARCLSIQASKARLREVLLEILDETEEQSVIAICAELNLRHDLELGPQIAGVLVEDPLQVAMHSAEVSVSKGQVAEALQIVDAALAESDLSEAQREIARLGFMDRFQLDGTAALWKRLLDQYPRNTTLLRKAMESPLVLRDVQLAPRVIDELRAMTGEEGLAWRFASLRHRAATVKNDAERIQVADELGAMIRGGYNKTQARLLLAQIFVRLENPRGAFNQLTQAVEENPLDAGANLAMIQLGLQEGRFEAAKTALGRLAVIENLAPSIAAEAARVAEALGERAVAQSMRSRPGMSAYLNVEERLGQLREALVAGESAQAAVIARELITSQDAQVLRTLAILQAIYGEDSAEQSALDALQRCEAATPSLIAMTRATIAELTGQPIEAYQILEAAIESGQGTDRALRGQYLRLLMAQEDAMEIAPEALRQLMNGEGTEADRVALYCFESAAATDSPASGMLQALGLEALESDTPIAFRLAAEAIVENSREAGRGPSARLIQRLEAVRASYPGELSLYNLMTNLYLMSGQAGQAITLAQQTQERFPDDAVSAQLLAEGLARTGQWNRALVSAQSWRQLVTPTPANLEAVDLLIATALIETGSPSTALTSLGDYGSDRAIALTIRSMIRLNRLSDAENLLFSLIRTESSRWRVTLIQLALTEVLPMNERAAARWLDEVEPLVPVDVLDEKLLLAQGQFMVGQQLENEARQDKAYRLMASISDDPAFPASGWLLIGVYHEARGQVTQAQEAYHQAITLDPNQHQAANNLANILFEQGELTQARELSEAAVRLTQARPRANYLDTLAQIERASEKPEQAETLWAQAVQLERTNPNWYLKLADLQVELGKMEEARETLRLMRQWADPIPEEDKTRLDELERLERVLG